MKWIWKHERALVTTTHTCLDRRGRLMGFVMRSAQKGDGLMSCWFARAYVSHTHDNGFFVKSLAEGKAIVEDMLAKEEAR